MFTKNKGFVLSSFGLDILKAVAYITDIEGEEKLCHSWRVAALAREIAMLKCKDSASAIYIAGLLHDVGTFDISNRMGHLMNHLEDKKNSSVRVHPQKGAAIVATLKGLIPVAKIILCHHEWINGKGYPRALKGEEISLESQILRLADKAAFLIDDKGVKGPAALKERLQGRVGLEFSRDLYESLAWLLNKTKLWRLTVNNNRLIHLNDEIFKYLPIQKNKSAVDDSLLLFFGRILDAKHAYTQGHSWRVAYFSSLIALALDLSNEEIERISWAAYLHDIGKLGIPKSILDKKGPLTHAERKIIEKHAKLSYEIVKRITCLKRIGGIVGADQEHWDGSGYPKKLKMGEIPLGARIIFVADAFDAMTSNRSYRKALSIPQAINELSRYSGRDFDPRVVGIATKIFAGFQNSAILACYINGEGTR